MWTSKILNSNYSNGVLTVTVEYAKGEQTFTESIDMTGGSMETLHRKVQAKLNTLDATDALNAEIATGPFIPFIPQPAPEEKLRTAIARIELIKKVVELGIIPPVTPKETVDDLLTQAKSDAKDAFDASNL